MSNGPKAGAILLPRTKTVATERLTDPGAKVAPRSATKAAPRSAPKAATLSAPKVATLSAPKAAIHSATPKVAEPSAIQKERDPGTNSVNETTEPPELRTTPSRLDPRPTKLAGPSKRAKPFPRVTTSPGDHTSDDDTSSPKFLRARRKRRKASPESDLHTSLIRSVLSPRPTVEASEHPDKTQKLADRRNTTRLKEADKQDEGVISKYLPSSVSLFLPAPVSGPDDGFKTPPNFLQNLRDVFDTPAPTPEAPPDQFETSPVALEHNATLLAESGFNMKALLAKYSHTTLGYGSEFRPLPQLKKVLGTHPHFAELTVIIRDGMDYRFREELSEPERQEEVQAMTKRGNHKSAEEEKTVVNGLLQKDVTHGFSMPLPVEVVPRVIDALVQPLGLAKQWTLDALGERVPKYRLTQDLSFSLTKETCSVNDRIDMNLYAEMVYGWCLGRIIHFIVALRLAHPHKKIFIAKYDYSDAYRRIAHAATAASQSISVFDQVAYLALRLTFGGSPNPPTWCLFSKMVTDLANEVLCCEEWDPGTLRSPAQPLTPKPKEASPDIPIALARPAAVEVPVSLTAKTDGFIDDLIQVFLDTPANRERAPHTVPLAIHLTSRPHAGPDEPIKRRALLSDLKLIAEGTPDELQTVLGWLMDTRRLLLRLPTEMFDAWVDHVKTMAQSGKKFRRPRDDGRATKPRRLRHPACPTLPQPASGASRSPKAQGSAGNPDGARTR